MTTFLDPRPPDDNPGRKSADSILRRALNAREALLARRPELRRLQAEIDWLLAAAGDAGNRMAVLEFLMEAHLMRLKATLTALSEGLAATRRGDKISPTERRKSE